MNNLLLFDFNNLLFKAIAVHPGFEYNDIYTGGVYGFINQICKYITEFEPRNVVVCSDNLPYLRKGIYPDYKSGRKKRSPEEYAMIQESRKMCEEFLDIIGIQLWSKKGFEADDLMYIVSEAYSYSFDKIVVVSNDDDLFQLFKIDYNIYLQRSKVLYGMVDFKNEYPDININDWCQIKALSGSHNAVPGIKGIGIKKAIGIIKDSIKLKEYKEKYEELDLYLKLVTLPYRNCKAVSLSDFDFNRRHVSNFLSKYRITTTHSMEKAFEILKG